MAKKREKALRSSVMDRQWRRLVNELNELKESMDELAESVKELIGSGPPSHVPSSSSPCNLRDRGQDLLL